MYHSSHGVADSKRQESEMTVNDLMRLAAEYDSAAMNILDMIDAGDEVPTDPELLQALYDLHQDD